MQASSARNLVVRKCCAERLSAGRQATSQPQHYANISQASHNSTKLTDLSTIRAGLLLARTHLSGMQVRMARGSTYSAISPLRKGFSIQILVPQARHPAKTPPNGPSRKLCDIWGRSRATTRVRTRQTDIQMEEMNVLRNVALRRVDMVKENGSRKS